MRTRTSRGLLGLLAALLWAGPGCLTESSKQPATEGEGEGQEGEGQEGEGQEGEGQEGEGQEGEGQEGEGEGQEGEGEGQEGEGEGHEGEGEGMEGDWLTINLPRPDREPETPILLSFLPVDLTDEQRLFGPLPAPWQTEVLGVLERETTLTIRLGEPPAEQHWQPEDDPPLPADFRVAIYAVVAHGDRDHDGRVSATDVLTGSSPWLLGHATGNLPDPLEHPELADLVPGWNLLHFPTADEQARGAGDDPILAPLAQGITIAFDRWPRHELTVTGPLTLPPELPVAERATVRVGLALDGPLPRILAATIPVMAPGQGPTFRLPLPDLTTPQHAALFAQGPVLPLVFVAWLDRDGDGEQQEGEPCLARSTRIGDLVAPVPLLAAVVLGWPLQAGHNLYQMGATDPRGLALILPPTTPVALAAGEGCGPSEARLRVRVIAEEALDVPLDHLWVGLVWAPIGEASPEVLRSFETLELLTAVPVPRLIPGQPQEFTLPLPPPPDGHFLPAEDGQARVAPYLPVVFFADEPPARVEEDALAGIALRRAVVAASSPNGLGWFQVAFEEGRADPLLVPIEGEPPLVRLDSRAYQEKTVQLAVNYDPQQPDPYGGGTPRAAVMTQPAQGGPGHELASAPLQPGNFTDFATLELPDLRPDEFDPLFADSALGELGLLGWVILYSEHGEPPLGPGDACLAAVPEPAILYLRHLQPFFWLQGFELWHGYTYLAQASFRAVPGFAWVQVAPCDDDEPPFDPPTLRTVAGPEPGQLDFVLANVLHNCCRQLTLRLVVNDRTLTLRVEEQGGEPCPCECASQVTGRLQELTTGPYQLRVERGERVLQSQQVQVPNGATSGFHPLPLPPDTELRLQLGPGSSCFGM